jgi:sortase A
VRDLRWSCPLRFLLDTIISWRISKLMLTRRRLAKLGAHSVRWLRKPVNFGELAQRFRDAAHTPRFSEILKLAEISLWVVAVASIGYFSVAYAGAAVHQRRAKAILSATRVQNGLAPQGDSAGTVPSPISATTAEGSAAPDYGVLGTIEIPRLNISSVVEEGVDSSTLWEAVGHLPGTAQPGQNGNSALASHRDTYFRGLDEVQIGDLIVFRSPTANFRYRVESTRIVDADATDALPDSATPTLSLITCYPFHYVGSAPKRFIVTARLDSPTP